MTESTDWSVNLSILLRGWETYHTTVYEDGKFHLQEQKIRPLWLCNDACRCLDTKYEQGHQQSPRWLHSNYSVAWIILFIIIKSEVWSIIHCLVLGHETMVCAVCLSIFLCSKHVNITAIKQTIFKRGQKVGNSFIFIIECSSSCSSDALW